MIPKVKTKVLIAHTDPLISAGLKATLGAMSEFEINVVGRSARLAADVAIADYDSGLTLLAASHAINFPVMILTHIDSEAKICRALEYGARGYLLLGVSLEALVDGLRAVYRGSVALASPVATRLAEHVNQRALTRRETDVLQLMMRGMTNKLIASKLDVALGTVKTHVKSVLWKFGVESRTQVVLLAQRRGLFIEESDEPLPSFAAGARRR